MGDDIARLGLIIKVIGERSRAGIITTGVGKDG